MIARSITQKHAENVDEPIPYTKSMANTWQAKSSRIGAEEKERLWFEPYVILGSVSVFLIYFCVLREESDIDQELGKSLYSRISGLEQRQLQIVLEYNKQHGKETSDIVERLQEIKEKSN